MLTTENIKVKNPRHQPSIDELEDLINKFSYHSPNEGQPIIYEKIRDKAGSLASYLLHTCPPSEELGIAIRRLEEMVFWANAAIARNE